MTQFFNTGLTQQQFLEQYWQKKPLLIRQAFADFASPVSAEELAGLACEEEIEARLIEENSEAGPWQVRHGPFAEQDFAELPASHWTLLVQDMDKHVPELRVLLKPFDFIPDWRRDDLMISYAPVGGSVGPHTDGYDVFLLQAQGCRRWQISHAPVHQAALIEGLDIRVLQEFEAAHSWDLQPGDMLYLPPHYAHHGVAMNDCMTFSVGFRAPKQLELLDMFMHLLVEQEKGQQHYADSDFLLREQASELTSADKQRFIQLMHQLIDDNSDSLIAATGRLLSETKPSLEGFADDLINEQAADFDIEAGFTQGWELERNRYLRFVWTQDNSGLTLFIAGESFALPTAFLPWMRKLTEDDRLTNGDWQSLQALSGAAELLDELIQIGAWYWP